jgi:uncharacterized phage protein (TIGR02218 family)
MSYATVDVSTESSNPLLLFQIAQGSTTYRYCLATESVTLVAEGHTWTPAVMVPSEFAHSNDVGKDTLKIELAANDPLALTFTNGVPDSVTTVTVFRTFTNPETELVMCWKGRVATHGLEPGRVVLNCDPIFTQLQRPGLRALYTKMCRHVLYGRGCNVSADSYKTTYTIYTISGSLVTLPAAPAHDGYWEGGVLTWANDGTSRMILKHKGGKLTLIRPIAQMNAYLAAHPGTGVNIWLFRGCDHSFSMCKSRFNNGGNYGGDPHFAQKNPFTTQVSFV